MCKYEGCRHHTSRDRYVHRPLFCRLSIHRHWQDCPSNSPPPWYNECLECGYNWVRILNGKGERKRWAWWWKAPWPIRGPLLWLSYRPWAHIDALLEAGSPPGLGPITKGQSEGGGRRPPEPLPPAPESVLKSGTKPGPTRSQAPPPPPPAPSRRDPGYIIKEGGLPPKRRN